MFMFGLLTSAAVGTALKPNMNVVSPFGEPLRAQRGTPGCTMAAAVGRRTGTRRSSRPVATGDRLDGFARPR
jgi:hypothetical protein